MIHKICTLQPQQPELQLKKKSCLFAVTSMEDYKKQTKKIAVEHLCEQISLIQNQPRNDKPVSERPQSSYLFDISNQVIQRVGGTMSLRKRRKKKKNVMQRHEIVLLFFSKVVRPSTV